MQLDDIIKRIKPLTVRGSVTRKIEGLAYDSRNVRPGFIFVALPGQRADGREFAMDAAARGAVAVVSEGPCEVPAAVTSMIVRDARLALAEIARAFYGNPSARLLLIGITGTNGKTTTSYFCRDILTASGHRAGMIGTISYEIGERRIPATRTTPESPDIQAMLDQMIRARCTAAVMEASSHGLDQKRVWGIDFDAAVFTNLSQDHLDYHGTMERYFLAKAKLFEGLGRSAKRGRAVINVDDPWGVRLLSIEQPGETITYGWHRDAQVRAKDVKLDAKGSSFELITPWGVTRARLSLAGSFNVYNALAAVAACGGMHIPLSVVTEALESLKSVPGRLERVPIAADFHVYVDYAHTPNALASVLETLRGLTQRNLIVVFGCGGHRDREKRPLMGAIAAKAADLAILTSDNPRDEAPEAIIADIEKGIPPGVVYEKETNREHAIAMALKLARPGDTVLIAGKGHETYQEFADVIIPFDDREVVKRLTRENS